MKGGMFEWALAATSALRRAVDSPTCVTGVHMIVARGSGEPAGLGRIAPVVNNVRFTIPGSDYTAIDYPATIAGYTDSLAEGTAEFHRLIKEYTQACPDTKIALLGYSQGAHAMMDTVCGSDQEGFEPAAELADAFQSHIIAIVAFGDPTHNVSAPWNEGTSENDGFFPRPSMTGCEPYSSMIRGYCDTGDVYCDRGTDRAVHGGYFAKYGEDAVEFIAANFKKATESSPTKSSTASSTASPTPSASSLISSGTAAPTTLTTTAPELSISTTPSGSGSPSSTATFVPSRGSSFGPPTWILIASIVLGLFG
ncbi:acetylxylan esterase 2 [Naviculisporaceae sp. PSN 640]